MESKRRPFFRWLLALAFICGIPAVLGLVLLIAWACGLVRVQLFPLPL